MATLINYLLKNEAPQKALDYACAVGGLVAQEKGANPKITMQGIVQFMDLHKN